MIKLILIALMFGVAFWLGYIHGYDQGFDSGCDVTLTDMQLKNMEAVMKMQRSKTESIVSIPSTDNAKYSCENCKHEDDIKSWNAKICDKCEDIDGKPSNWEGRE